jgi:3-oxoacyl-[acyl-carrier-protein] synthase-3
MSVAETHLTEYLLSVMRGVLEDLGGDKDELFSPEVRFPDVFDSMAMVEFLGIVADDCGCEMAAIEECVDQRFSTVEQLARAMSAAGLAPADHSESPTQLAAQARGRVETPIGKRTSRQLADLEAQRVAPAATRAVWLAGSANFLPRTIQSGAELDAAVGRPTGWLERRAGILQRRVWGDEDPIEAASACAAESLWNARVRGDRLGALVTVSEAPPIAVGLAAAVHQRLELNKSTPCFETGGACTGFLSAISLARTLVHQFGPVLILSVEAHSKLLPLKVGPHGESAALFGDGCAAIVLGAEPGRGPSARLIDVQTLADGGAADLIRILPAADGGFCIEMEGVPLTEFALHALATVTRDMIAKHGLSLGKLSAIVAHGGNGRMPAMLARLLHVPATKIWSEVQTTGNLGSASVPVAWSSRPAPTGGPVVWTSVGAGVIWGAALWEVHAAGR